jgi:hypothetical protein
MPGPLRAGASSDQRLRIHKAWTREGLWCSERNIDLWNGVSGHGLTSTGKCCTVLMFWLVLTAVVTCPFPFAANMLTHLCTKSKCGKRHFHFQWQEPPLAFRWVPWRWSNGSVYFLRRILLVVCTGTSSTNSFWTMDRHAKAFNSSLHHLRQLNKNVVYTIPSTAPLL